MSCQKPSVQRDINPWTAPPQAVKVRRHLPANYAWLALGVYHPTFSLWLKYISLLLLLSLDYYCSMAVCTKCSCVCLHIHVIIYSYLVQHFYLKSVLESQLHQGIKIFFHSCMPMPYNIFIVYRSTWWLKKGIEGCNN